MAGTANASVSVAYGRPGDGLVPPAGFEPTAVRLEGGCSIQLSYGGS